jgi:replicative DNA helicase
MTTSTPAPLLYAQEAEEAVIGSVLMSQGRTFAALRERLSPDDFWSRRHRLYWQMFERLTAQELPIDLTIIADDMMRLTKDDLELSGGPAYVMEMITTTPTSWHAESYASRVLEMSIRRQALDLLDKTRVSLTDLAADSRSILAGADRNLLRLRSLQGMQDNPTRDMDAFALNLFEMLLEAEKRTAANPEYVIGDRSGRCNRRRQERGHLADFTLCGAVWPAP